ncbi:MAG: DUF3644 domain-containing protein, partial [Candidatus Thermoplasmatota archaeon]|nr:DUF3644 domain-containing protein [Candidatus Thermoplasmatota archaeon]
IFNNPLMTFKTESFIILFNIAWTYLLHAYYRSKYIDYKYYEIPNVRKKYIRNSDGTIRYWDLMKCLKCEECPLDENTKNNLKFLIGLRNYIVHQKVPDLDSYLSARYQACALNYDHYLVKLHGKNYSLGSNLALSLQFAELDYEQHKIMKDKLNKIPKEIKAYIADFDKQLTDEQRQNERYSYKLLFIKTNAKSNGQADRVIEFLDPNSDLSKNISKEYWVKVDREKPKYLPSQVVEKVKVAGFPDFKIHHHTDIWKENDGKNPNKGYGVNVAGTWYWYENWIDFVINKKRK